MGTVKAEEGRHFKMCYKHFNLARQPDGVCWRNKGTLSGGTGGAGSLNALRTHWFRKIYIQPVAHMRGAEGLEGAGTRLRWDGFQHGTTKEAPHFRNCSPFCTLFFFGDDSGRAMPRGCLSGLKSVNRCSQKPKSNNDLISLSILPLSVFFSPLEKPSSHSQQLLLGNSTHPDMHISASTGKIYSTGGRDTSCKSLIVKPRWVRHHEVLV